MKYYCQTCNQQFDSFSKFRKHNETHPHICKYCREEFETGRKLGNHVANCKFNPNYEQNLKRKKQKLKQIKTGSHHTQQAKQLMSKRRQQYLKLHPQDNYWKKNNKTISKPCEDLKQFLTNNNINFYPQYSNPQQFKNHHYRIDIAFPNQKIAIEVNGTMHYQKTGKLKSKYQLRHNIIQNAGWKILEIPFKETYSTIFRESLLKLINQNIQFTYDYRQQIIQFYKQKEQQHICPICGGQKKDVYSKCCVKCNGKISAQNRYKEIPSKQQLIKDREQLYSYAAIGEKYQKSKTAIRRWFKKYNLC